MDTVAPSPTMGYNKPNPVSEPVTENISMASSDKADVAITIIGAGGGGSNICRSFMSSRSATVKYFDTSMANSRVGESVNVLGGGEGSGGHRSANAHDIERSIPKLSDEELGVGDVAIVVFTLAGGSGSVLGPLLIKEFVKGNRGSQRVIAVCIADTSSTVAATNTQNTLKTLNAIANKNGIYLPLIVVSNDGAPTRRQADEAVVVLIQSILHTLTSAVYEVDKNDRLNWIDPSDVTGSPKGIKIMSFSGDKLNFDPKIVLGTDSDEMVDSLLILQSSHDEPIRDKNIPLSRLKKVGIYTNPDTRIVASVTGDISCVNSIIEQVDRMKHATNAHKNIKIDRLDDDSDTEVFL